MFKLTAVAAALSVSLFQSAAFARAEKASEDDPEEHALPAVSVWCKPIIVEPVIEEIPASAPQLPPDQTPIVLTPADWPRRATITEHLQDPAVVSSIPTWPTWYESVYLPSQAQARRASKAQAPKAQAQPRRYAARYRSPGTATPAAEAPVVWGPDVVPIVEMLPPTAPPASRR